MPTKNKNTGGWAELHIGMKLEVLTKENQSIFVGQIIDKQGSEIRVQTTSRAETPPVLYNTEVKLRGFLPGMRPVMILGRIRGSTQDFWCIECIRSLYAQENRGFFRQNISADAKVMCVNSIFQPDNPTPEKSGIEACHLLDISGSGLRLSCRRQYAPGDWLFIMEADIWPKEAPFSFTCQVRRAEETRWDWVYGCEFQGLDPKEQDRLLRVILQLQRRELQAQRNQ